MIHAECGEEGEGRVKAALGGRFRPSSLPCIGCPAAAKAMAAASRKLRRCIKGFPFGISPQSANVILTDPLVSSSQRSAAAFGVRYNQPVERIARPVLGEHGRGWCGMANRKTRRPTSPASRAISFDAGGLFQGPGWGYRRRSRGRLRNRLSGPAQPWICAPDCGLHRLRSSPGGGAMTIKMPVENMEQRP